MRWPRPRLWLQSQAQSWAVHLPLEEADLCVLRQHSAELTLTTADHRQNPKATRLQRHADLTGSRRRGGKGCATVKGVIVGRA